LRGVPASLSTRTSGPSLAHCRAIFYLGPEPHPFHEPDYPAPTRAAATTPWIFNTNTKTLFANQTYAFFMTLTDASVIQYQCGVK
jgi:hypothetical protein